ncbi:MAG: hypothetical protein V9F04_16910 [Dermatophilaceae bacterium]
MSDYLRNTRICLFPQLAPALVTALRAYGEQQQLGDLAATAVRCCETISRKPKKGLFGKEEVIVTGVVLTPLWLVWAAGQPGQPPTVLSARLGTFTVQDYGQKSPLQKLAPDTGVNVNGLLTDGVHPGTAFIGFGPEPAAAEFRAALSAALAAP